MQLSKAVTVMPTVGRSREEQYEWLKSITDPKSGLEIPFLDFLYQGEYRLPDAAQNRPAPDVPAQPDFYYERDLAPGVCVFIDGPDHDNPERKKQDAMARSALEDRGFWVITIRGDKPFAQQVAVHPGVFGSIQATEDASC